MPSAVFTKAILLTRKQHIHLTKTMQVHGHPQYKYMNISTIQVYEHYKTQHKTENTEENTENTKANQINVLPGKEPGPSSLLLIVT
jgi:hypothetical protein